MLKYKIPFLDYIRSNKEFKGAEAKYKSGKEEGSMI